MLACGGGGSSDPSFEFTLADFLDSSNLVSTFDDDIQGELTQAAAVKGVSVRYETERPMRRRFCLYSEDGVNHSQTLSNAQGTTLLRMNSADAEKCRIVTLSPGSYELTLLHDGTSPPAQVRIVGSDSSGNE